MERDPDQASGAAISGRLAKEHSRPLDLDELYESFAVDVERWVRRLRGPSNDVEDIVHDVFVKAIQAKGAFRGEASPRTWLFRIAHNLIISRRRKEALRNWLLLVHGQELNNSPETQDSSPPEAALRTLYAAIDRLPEKLRTPLIMYELEELSGDDIVDLLGITHQALWVRLHRARNKLLKVLNKGKV